MVSFITLLILTHNVSYNKSVEDLVIKLIKCIHFSSVHRFVYFLWQISLTTCIAKQKDEICSLNIIKTSFKYNAHSFLSTSAKRPPDNVNNNNTSCKLP